ncbi:MAG: hypothetical protein Q8P57_03625 [Candidatus Pacearchaeota archaeon]|nr:hypothetical protein [Candidatus Pacearchaeota archaeon]
MTEYKMPERYVKILVDMNSLSDSSGIRYDVSTHNGEVVLRQEVVSGKKLEAYVINSLVFNAISENVRRIEEEAVRKLHAKIRGKKLEGFLDD